MAKGNLILGTARGKLGSVVLRRSRGQQVTSVKVTPSNPKSEAQCQQRMVFATSVSAAARLRKIVDHSFEGVAVGQDSVNYFSKLNIAMLRAGRNYAGTGEDVGNNNYLIKGAKGLALMPFTISHGQLSFPQVTWGNTWPAGSTITYEGAQLSGTTHSFLAAASISDAKSYATALGLIGLAPGDQLTMVAAVTDDSVEAEYTPYGAVNYTNYVEFARVCFKTAAEIDFSVITNGSVSLIDTANGNFNPIFVDFEKSSEWVNQVVVEPAANGEVIIAPITSGPVRLTMVGLIRSARGESGWLRSTSKMVVGQEGDAAAWQVWPSYGNQEADTSSSLYLNQPTGRRRYVQSDEGFAPVVTGFSVSIVSGDGDAIAVSDVVGRNLGSAVIGVRIADANGVVLRVNGGFDDTEPITEVFTEGLPAGVYTVTVYADGGGEFSKQVSKV